MNRHHFISYSSADAQHFALRLCDTLVSGPPSIPIWLDKRQLVAGTDWDEQLVEAIRDCESLIFVMTCDSVAPGSVCKQEWTRALKYKKPVIPIRLHAEAELPFRLEPRQFIDFSSNFNQALAKLRCDLQFLSSPAGALQHLKYRLADAERDLKRAADEAQKIRIQDDIRQLEGQIADQQKIVDDPEGAAKRVQESIERGLEREREPKKPVTGIARSKFINPPPGVAPSYFQDRHVETKLIADFLNDESLRMMTVVGRGGVGKTAMVCRLLKSLESAQLPDDLGPMSVDGIVYLSGAGSRRVNLHNIFVDLCKLLPDETALRLDALYKHPQASTEAKMQALLESFPGGRTVLLLDNFEDVVDPETLKLRDAELDGALRTLLNAPHHAVKAVITTRLTPRDLLLTQPGRQRRRDIDEGLESPYAENILREMDADGKLGLKTASDEVLNEARKRTRGYPRALEALFAILSADRDTSLEDVLNDTEKLLPEHVVEALVGEAFNRLDTTAEQVMQALAVYGRPVTPAAIDYLLQPYRPGVNSAPVLSRLVNMQFARKEAKHYYLHPVDRAYALSRVPVGDRSDRDDAAAPRYTQFALLHRGAEYFKRARTPRDNWKTIEDLAPQLAEFDLRFHGQDYEAAAAVLFSISAGYLLVWGHYHLMAELHDRLQGKLAHPYEKEINHGNLGTVYQRLGKYEQAIRHIEQALVHAREQNARRRAGIWLANLGNCYESTGHTARAIDYHEQALAISRDSEDRQAEGCHLGNLGFCYANLGQTARSLNHFQGALILSRAVKDRQSEACGLANIANVLIDEGRYQEAADQAIAANRIATDINSSYVECYSKVNLALAYLYNHQLAGARDAITSARQYNEPEDNHFVLALQGLIARRQGDKIAAQESFVQAIREATELLSHTTRNYFALDAKGLALCGLTLCDGVDRTSAAVEAYRAARAVNQDAGIVGRVLRLFDALAVVDSAGVLKDVRTTAAGD